MCLRTLGLCGESYFTVNPKQPKVNYDYKAPSPEEMNSRNLTCNS